MVAGALAPASQPRLDLRQVVGHVRTGDRVLLAGAEGVRAGAVGLATSPARPPS